MRSIPMIVIALFLIGCSNTDNEEGNSASTTQTEELSMLLPPSEELKAQGYNDEYIKVRNTKKPDYNAYRKQWTRVNDTPIHEGYRLTEGTMTHKERETHKPTEVKLDDLSFNHVFHIQYCAKGEGHTFWWRGEEYTTNLLIESDYPSVDEE